LRVVKHNPFFDGGNMSLKAKLILNPIADMGRAWKIANDLRPIANQHGAEWSGTVYPTHATELARQAAEQGYERVIALGGDGTAHEVVNGLMQVPPERRPVMGVVPIGSGNDFAHALGVPMSASRALAHALEGTVSTIDLGLMTDENGRQEYIDNTAGIGFDAVVTIRSHKLPLLRGFLMYLVAVLQTIITNHTPANLQLDIDGQKIEQSNLLLAVCNGPREGGGFVIAPDAKNDDGNLNYVMISRCSRLTMLRILPEVMRGTHAKFPQVTLGTMQRLSLVSDHPLYIHVDGEVYTSFGSNLRRVSFEICPNALKIVKG
jgi:diacylglycerol kinase (ATP)